MSQAPLFKRILIANRGEIACRVIATCRRLGIETVAVHSEADRGARHVRLADLAVEIGPAEASASYLVAERILEAAPCHRRRGHPSRLRLPVGERDLRPCVATLRASR
jgi:3-methylcrotonyl-CoA carboxylase alpha subunit